MKSSQKGFFAGMITMLLIISTIGTAGATYGRVQKSLEYRDIGVTLNGVKLNLRDAKGNSVEPFMFDGTNYLPVRALAEALGLSVAWDGATNTVVLNGNIANQTGKTPTQNGIVYYSGTHAPKLENVTGVGYYSVYTASNGITTYYYRVTDLPQEKDFIDKYLSILNQCGFYALNSSGAPAFFQNKSTGETVVFDFGNPENGFDDYYVLISVTK